MHDVIQDIVRSDSARRQTYKDINVYRIRHTISENQRLSFTRFRVSGLSLMCETGRWNRRGRGRLPLDERVCLCGDVQTERHVVENCVWTHHITDTYNFTTMEHLFNDNFAPDVNCKIVHLILSTYY